MLELEGWEATFHATIPIMHLPALKDLRSTFELGPKDTNALGKAIFIGRVGLDNHLVADAFLCNDLYQSSNTINDHYQTKCWKKWSGFGLTSLTGFGGLEKPKTQLIHWNLLVPYTSKHRYWTGLLLLVWVSVYLVSAFNPSQGDPRLTLSATTFIMTSLFLYIATFGVRMYKNHFMETLTYFNIIALSIFTWYTIDADTNQTTITNVSDGITFIQLVSTWFQ